MVNNKIAQRAVAAGLSGLMAFGAAAPAALAYNKNVFKYVSTSDSDSSDHWKRLGGADRYATMKKVVEAYNEAEVNLWWTLRKGTRTDQVWNYHSTAVLASGDNFPDALAANGLAGYLTNEQLVVNGALNTNGSVPVILTKAGTLSAEAKDLIKQMQVQNVIIMGGTAAVSQDVEDAINKMGVGTSRVAGADRMETSVKAFQRINGNWKAGKATVDVIIASGKNFADALSISPYAYRMGTPIILTDSEGKLTQQEVDAIKGSDVDEIVIVGGTDAVKDEVLGQIGSIKKNGTPLNAVRVAGADRYETSAKIAEFEMSRWSKYAPLAGFTLNHAVVATGEKFPDALVGGQLAGGLGSLIDVTGFTAADLNAWTPCPLLLVKNGDTRAESMIAQGLAGRWGKLTQDTASYASLGSWLNTMTNWYGADDTTNKEWQSLFKDWYAFGLLGGLWISDAAIDGNSGSDTASQFFPKAEGTATYTFKIKAKGATATPKAIVDDLYVTGENGKSQQLVVPAEESIKVTGETGAKKVTFRYNDAIHNTTHTVAFDVDDDTATEINNLISKGTGDDVTFTNKVGKYTIIGQTATTDSIYGELGSWRSDIVAYIDYDYDFYGIILGGTEAVSNSKRDDLEDVVKRVAKRDDVYTVGSADDGTISVLGADGIRRNYRRLKLVKDDASWAGGTGQSAATGITTGYTGDVYEIAATGSHVVAVFDKDGNFVRWIYYYGNNAQLKTDWNV